MVFDIPHLYEVEEMADYAKRHQPLYIYGCGERQEYLLRFFDICGIPVAGYITTGPDDSKLQYRQIDKYSLSEVDLDNAGVIIGLSDKYYEGVIPKLRERGFYDYFTMSEYNKRNIAGKLTPRPREKTHIEINLVDHCNLNCKMCDHFSPLVKEPYYLDINVFERDMKRLAELSGNYIGVIELEGGEPLLHKDLNRFVEISRKLFPYSELKIYTNGILLSQSENHASGNFWRCCKDNGASICLTTYPIGLDTEKIKAKAESYGVRLVALSDMATGDTDRKQSWKFPFDLSGAVGKHEFIECFHFNNCIALRNGRIYPCPVIPYAHYFNEAFSKNLVISEEDSIDIYEAEGFEEVSRFVASRVPFCRYCDVKNRRRLRWDRSKQTIDEYVDL